MELKKSQKADLERSRGIFLQIGMVLVLSMIWFAFEWTNRPDKDSGEKFITDMANGTTKLW